MKTAPPNHKIIYIAFGGPKYYAQLQFSVLTLLHLLLEENRTDIHIHVYCDYPAAVPEHPLVKVIQLSAAELRAYRGPMDYVHRVKPAVLDRAERELGLPFLYVDTDTRWLRVPEQPLERLSDPGGAHAYMHVLEGEVSAANKPYYHRLLRGQTGFLSALGIDTQGPWALWNSGVVGLPVQARGFFSRVLALNDQLIPRCWRRTWVEQLSISLLAVSEFQVQSLDQWLEHYWDKSGAFDVILQPMMQQIEQLPSIEQRARRCAGYAWDMAQLRAVRDNPAFRAQLRKRKLHASFRKRIEDLRIAWNLVVRSR